LTIKRNKTKKVLDKKGMVSKWGLLKGAIIFVTI